MTAAVLEQSVTPTQNPQRQQAQTAWANTPLRARLDVLRNTRHELARIGDRLVDAISPELTRTRADSYAAEVLPLLAACRFLEQSAQRILKPRCLGRKGLPFWLAGIDTTIERVPFGTVLVIAPSNYPLFLAGVQTLQALAAGNAIVWKPGRGGRAVAELVQQTLAGAGLPDGLLRVTEESTEAAIAAIQAKPGKIFFTGSAQAGRSVLHLAADLTIPVVAELSGCDAVIALPSADHARVRAALSFGLRLNGGNTCMAPRRLILVGEGHPEMEIDPALAVLHAADFDEVVAIDRLSPCGLTISIFGNEAEARALAARLQAGAILINDLIVPTADPRVPFGGRRASGFGVTRGAEGLLEMTAVKVIAARTSRSTRHYEPTGPAHEELFRAALTMSHSATLRQRFTGLRSLIAAARRFNS